MANISVFLCQYHVHDEESGEYTLMLSSKGNEEFVSENTKLLGRDTLGDCKLNFLKFKPVFDKESGKLSGVLCTQVMLINPGGAPSMVINRIAREH